ncbi:hypothetical protein EDD11_004608 [Mortierella claussenii]|nr:hypothetical protein EDD11_004608 [Mortierella claussenii]
MLKTNHRTGAPSEHRLAKSQDQVRGQMTHNFSFGNPRASQRPSEQREPSSPPAPKHQPNLYPRQELARQCSFSTSRHHNASDCIINPSFPSSGSTARTSYARHDRVKGAKVAQNHVLGEHSRLQDLFQKARSQIPINSSSSFQHSRRQQQPQQGLVRTPVARHSSLASSSELTCPRSSVSPRSTRRSGPTIAEHRAISSTTSDSTQSRQDMIHSLRAMAEETRLELLALEQLERDVSTLHGEPGHYGMQSDEERRPLGPLLQSETSPSSLSLKSHPVKQAPCRYSVDQGRRVGVEPQLTAAGQPQMYAGLPQKPYQRVLVETHATHGQSSMPARSRLSLAPSSSIGYNSETGASPKHKALFVKTSYNSVRPTHASGSSICSPLSLFTPISLVSPFNDTEATNSSILFRVKKYSYNAKQCKQWKTVSEKKLYAEDSSPDESVLYEQFDVSQEDIRDVTLSEMMNRHLVTLSDECDEISDSSSPGISDSSSTAENFSANNNMQDSGGDRDQDYIPPSEDLSFANQTCYFMSRLNRAFDERTGVMVPSLFAETIPDSDFGNLSFLTHCPDPAETVASSKVTDTYCHLPSVDTPKGSILKEFLKSPPSLSLSSEAKWSSSSPALSTYVDQVFAPASLATQVMTPLVKPTTSIIVNSARVVAPPAALVTSRERYQQTLQQQIKSPDQQYSHLQSPVRSLPSPSSIMSTTDTAWSALSLSLDLQSEWQRDSCSKLATSASVDNSVREELTAGGISVFFDACMDVLDPRSTKTIPPEILSYKEDNANDLRSNRTPTASTVSTTLINSTNTAPEPSRQPLDMIIVRPIETACRLLDANNAVTSEKTSPWSPLSPASAHSSASESLTISSWSWSWPPSTLHSRVCSPAPAVSSEDSQQGSWGSHVESTTLASRPRLSSMFCNSNNPLPSGINIKSRSMSSLVKHHNGWLGFKTLDVKMVDSGLCHIVVVTRSNQVYSCWEPDRDVRDNNDDRGHARQREGLANELEIEITLGRSTQTQTDAGLIQDTTFQPGLVQISEVGEAMVGILPPNIVKIACSDSATFILTDNGHLWGWGFFKDTQGNKLGILDEKPASRPIQICTQRVKDVVCGRNHVLILTIQGDVISWGANDHHQLGRRTSIDPLGHQGNVDLSPFFIDNIPSNIIGIGAGKLSSFAWDEERLYGWGDNTFGQLGGASSVAAVARLRLQQQQQQQQQQQHQMQELPQKRETVQVPKEISLHWKGKSLKQVQGGERHTVILTLSGLVLTMGNDDYNQLGTVSALTPTPSATLLTPTSSITTSGAEATIAAPKSITKPRKRPFPALVRIGPGVKEIGCGDFHTVTCNEAGHMFIWGRGFDGILAIHSLQNPSLISINSNTAVPPSVIERQSREKACRVVAVSTMRSGVSIALVSNN